MPDSVIKKVEAFGKSSLGVFNFANRNSILFEWNKVVDECPEGIVEEDVILYPSLVAKFLGVTLGRDHPIPTIKEDIMLQGRDKPPLPATPTWSRLPPQEWTHQQSFTPT
jgi:hypothetical protein